MASRMRIWMGLVLGGIALILVWTLPPQSYEDWRGRRWGRGADRLPERMAYNAVLRQVLRENWIYQRLQWRDSVEALAGEARATGRLWSAVLPDSAPASFRSGLEDAVTAQLDAKHIQEPRVPVGIVLMDGRAGGYATAPPGNHVSPFDQELFVGRDTDAPFCYVVRPLHGSGPDLERVWNRVVWAPADESAAPNPLGPCLLHARYGMPGPQVMDWLAERGYAMAIGSRGVGESPDLQPAAGRAFPALGRRTLWGEGMPEAEACLAGKVDGCQKALQPDSLSDTRIERWRVEVLENSGSLISRIPEYGFYLPFAGRESALLWDLEEAFGEERFQEFWHSDLEVEAAFRAAFDIGFPEWVMEWGQERFGVSRVGATVPFHATLLSLLSIVALAAVALFTGRRRG
ncbi:MAG: hypothetical protein ACWGSQ_16010 [Longimicrobiales bacterium]